MAEYKISLGLDFNGPRYGIEFFRGVGKTDDERIAAMLKEKGISVEPVSAYDTYTPPPDPEPEKPRRGRPAATQED